MQQVELVEQARRGDHDAFAVLAGAAISRLDALARLILRDPERGKDAPASVFDGDLDGLISAGIRWRKRKDDD